MSEERDYDGEARQDGWKPEGEWKGDPPNGGFKTAEQFVTDGENINGLLKGKVERLEARVNEVMESNKSLNEMSQRQIAKEKTEKAGLIKELQDAKAQAITDGDGVAVVNAENRISELQKEPQPQGHQLDPQQKAWLEGNPWYETNEKLAAFADGISDRLIGQGFTGQAYFAELTNRTKEAFPSDFANPNRSRPSSVEAGGEAGTESSERTFANLPKEAKQQFAMDVKNIPGFTKEQFVEFYDWD